MNNQRLTDELHPKSKRFSAKRLIFVAVVVIVAITVTLVQVYLAKPVVTIPDDVRTSINVTLVMPNKLPDDFKVSSQPSYDSSAQVVITRFENSKGHSITLTQQKKPENVSLRQIETLETYLDEPGTVYVLNGEENRIQTIIENSDSWIYVDGTASTTLAVVKQFINRLEAIE